MEAVYVALQKNHSAFSIIYMPTCCQQGHMGNKTFSINLIKIDTAVQKEQVKIDTAIQKEQVITNYNKEKCLFTK